MKILIDCDGVLAQYTKTLVDFLNLYNSYNGKITNYTPEDILGWHCFQYIKDIDKETKSIVREYIGNNAYYMPVVEGAIDSIKYLKSRHDVHILTSPYHSKTWVYDRNRWLKKHFDIDGKSVTYTFEKEQFSGDCFIDDKVENISKWHANHPSKLAILFDTPQNRDLSNIENQNLIEGFRAKSWANVIEKINAYSGL